MNPIPSATPYVTCMSPAPYLMLWQFRTWTGNIGLLVVGCWFHDSVGTYWSMKLLYEFDVTPSMKCGVTPNRAQNYCLSTCLFQALWHVWHIPFPLSCLAPLVLRGQTLAHFFFLRMSISVCVRVHALRTSGLFHCGLTRVHRDPVQEAGSSYEISLPWSVCYANRVLETGTDLEKEVTMSEPSLEQAMP